jgi:endonuclease YncB( thermonuclease family)
MRQKIFVIYIYMASQMGEVHRCINLARCFLCLIGILVLSQANAETIIGKAIGVTDGDTIEILEQGNHVRRIRLSGIDAPEKGQPFDQRSKQSLSDLVFGKQVEAETSKIDRYGRAVAKVFINGKDVNLEQIKKGWHGITKNIKKSSL